MLAVSMIPIVAITFTVRDHYPPDQLPVDPSRLRMPEEWFVDWLDRLNRLAPPPVSE
jgi:hypothetical protein